jgi:cytochrome c peroxidase
MMARYRWLALVTLVLLLASPSLATAAPTKESVGKKIYFDADLSSPKGMSCATCHDPSSGFADPRGGAVSAGIIEGLFGNRNAPTSAYAYLIPPFHFDDERDEYVGGQFWDGRADTLEDQAKGPFLNPLEMHMPSSEIVVLRVSKSDYADEFRQVFGRDSLDKKGAETSFGYIAEAIAAYERSAEVNPFSSKHDVAMTKSGPQRMQMFTMQERRGMMLFRGKGKCATCHPGAMMMGGGGMGGGGMGGGGMGGDMPKAPFSDFAYDNLGLPANPANPFYLLQPKYNQLGLQWIDLGLGGRIGDRDCDGMFRVPTLRNVEKTAPYGHNGYFATLKDIVHFYNTRDVAGAGWPVPEVADTMNHTIGTLGLTSAEEDDIVAFLKTLTDGYQQ